MKVFIPSAAFATPQKPSMEELEALGEKIPVAPGDTLVICHTPDNEVIAHIHLSMTDELTIDCISPGEEATAKSWLGPQRRMVMAFMRDIRHKTGTSAEKGSKGLLLVSGERV